MPEDDELRFSPPRAEPTPELALVLRLAYAEPEVLSSGSSGSAANELDAGALCGLAERLGLAARIAARLDGPTLTGLVGNEAAARLLREQRNVVARSLAFESLAGNLARIAAEICVPVVWLKGFALHLAGVGATGSRDFADLDLLSSTAGAQKLWELLVTRGFGAAAPADNEQHLPPLTAPGWGVVDVHFRLEGVRLADGEAATAERLLAGGHCLPVDRLPGDTWVPSTEVLAAHALAHGIDQHGFRPGGYPLLRMVSDLVDLLPTERDWRRFRETDAARLEGRVTPAECGAAERLCLDLAAGRLPLDEETTENDAAVLLRHIVAGSLDPDYGASLRPSHTRRRLASVREESRLLHYVSGKLFPTAGEIERRYGVGGWRRAGYRVLHPFRILARFAGDAGRRLRLRLRRRPERRDPDGLH